jgi:four helix bundle protein
MEKFQTLKVYQRALLLCKEVRIMIKKFPKDEIFGLISQFRRAVDSIVLNIAEGAGNSSKKEFARFLDFSIRSGFECIGCLDIALTNDYIDIKNYETLKKEVNEIVAMLHGLKKSLFKTNSSA